MSEGWKIKVSDSAVSNNVDFFIVNYTPSGTEILYFDKGVPSPKKIDEGAFGVKPSFSIDRFLLPALLKEIKDLGVNLPDEGFKSGELKSTKYHLEDMRTLLKLK